MPLGQLGLLPPELIRHVCYQLPLDDIINLQKSHSLLEIMIDNVFFVDMKSMEVNCDAHGTVVCLSAPSTSNQFSTTTTSDSWKEAVFKSRRVSKLSVRKSDDAQDCYVLDVIERAELRLLDVEMILLPGQQETSQTLRNRIFPRLTEFVRSSCQTLTRFRLQTDPLNSIEYSLHGSNATLAYSQSDDSQLQQQMVIPLFHALIGGRKCPSMLTLRIGWREKPMMALQAAFHAALPRNQRSMLQVLRLDFGNDVSTLSNEEIQEVLSQYAPYLNDTRQLQHLILDLSHSQLLASELEKLYSIISRELPQTHRISLYTSECLPKVESARKQKHSNVVTCS
ncbi:unnamed protein product [Cylicocyclus nassatus]|uniref:F-box domain-containing protein n=1 Tax=Cylicocyclus nassatus TaxID=53992 RepID=A0AA36GKZ7_CYLNA|nr:unnamed protein product [Cylicocyclus nassatus]